MRGVQYVMDENGERTAVLIDLKKNGDLWENFCDVAISRERAQEPRESHESVKKRLLIHGNK